MPKKNPPGSRIVGGKLMVPFQGPKPRKRAPGETNIRIGNYRADVDTTGWSEAEKKMIRKQGR